MTGTGLGFAAFALVAGSMVLWFRRMGRVKIPADRSGFVACWVGGAVLGLLAFSQGPDYLGGIAAGLAVLAGTLFSVLVFISPQRVAGNAVRVGETLRGFTAPDENGAEFSIASVAGRPVLLKFFRGHW